MVFSVVEVLCRLNSLYNLQDGFRNRVHILVGRLVGLGSPKFDGQLHSVRSEDDSHSRPLHDLIADNSSND